mgnify:CR=1 FL=1
MVVVPTSKIILLKNPIEIDYLNELTFANKTAQYNYFSNLPKLECDNATYQRKEEVIRFPTDPDMVDVTYDDLIQYNYCMYQNDKWSNKWFYAFVKEVIFDNPGMSYIKIETDVWQTWCFDITLKNSFIEREHVNDDTIGLHIVPENLEIGEPVSYSKVEELNDPNNFKVCFAITETPDEDLDPTLHKNISGIYGGLYYLVADTMTDADNIIKIYDIYNKANAIISIFMIPRELCDLLNYTTWVYHSGQSDEIQAKIREVADGKYYDSATTSYKYSSAWITTTFMELPTKIGTYTPKNNKLFIYPYNYVNATNNVGTTIPFKFEDSYYIDLSTNKKNIAFDIEACVTGGLSMKAVPKKYMNIEGNYMYGITLGKIPMCSWNSDYYLNWQTQQGVNTVINGVASILPAATSAAMGVPSGFTGAITGIFNTLHQFRVADMTPNQARGNINSGDINFAFENSGGFSLYLMGIKEQYAKIIDDYFTMFGYQVNTVKTPNVTGRTYWNYVKTIGCNLIGDIPQMDLEKIKDIFNNGVTFWHDPTKFLDYSQNNTIVISQNNNNNIVT